MSVFNAIELTFRAIKRITYSNLYNSMEEVYNDAINFLKGEQIKKTLYIIIEKHLIIIYYILNLIWEKISII